MSDRKMMIERVLAGARLLIFGAALSGGAVTAGEHAELDWETAIAAFAVGEQQSPMVFNMKDAARCRGRWMLHADAVDDGAFPEAAIDAMIDQLRLPAAVNAIDFFLTEDRDHPAARDAASEAERLLTRTLAGDPAAARTYFENLGLCSTLPEAVQDGPAVATDAEATAQQPVEPPLIEPAASDFDEPVNQQRLAFVEFFAQRLRNGAPVADLFKPRLAFFYMDESDRAALTTGYVDGLPASDVDNGITFEATYSWKNPDCSVPSELVSVEGFNLAAVISRWDAIEVAVDDHNFADFVFQDEARNDYLLISIEPYRKGYAVSRIEYHLKPF
ncbi:hypothetical protein [Parasphingorhabdus sp.]|uniref:hypothetical protein n=1 Tax=Parasphingorhabdus sp. TaxID=2709688 RepID=UPI003A8FB9B3